MSDIPFPEGPQDGDIFFHLDKVCLYHGDSQTWECRNRAELEDPEPPTTIFTTDVYCPESSCADFQARVNAMGINYTVPHIVTQKDFNAALIDFALSPDIYNVEDEDNATKTWVEAWVAERYAPIYHLHNYASTTYVDNKVDEAIAAIPAPNVPDDFVTHVELETRLLSSLPTNVITQDELEPRIQTLNASYVNYVEQRLTSIESPDLSGYATTSDFTALTGTITAAINQVAANVETKATQQDVQLAGAAVDAKFDMLRSAIAEATDFETLKARLLAVLT